MAKGTSGGKRKSSKFSKIKSGDNLKDVNKIVKKSPKNTKTPTTGAKVQQDFIEYVKEQTNVNLTSARDTYFDTRSYFNIDTRKLDHNDLSRVQSLLMRGYDGGFDVTIMDNGAYRKAIYVKRKNK